MMSGAFNRLRILLALLKKPMHSSQVEKELGLGRPYGGFHLAILEEKGLIKGEMKVIDQPTKDNKFKGKAGRFYSVTDKGKAYLNFVLMNIVFFERAWNVKR